MNNNNFKTLVGHLEQESLWIDELNSLLSDEKNMLATRQFALLEELANKKQILSTKIEESAKQRMDLMNNYGPHGDPNLVLKEFIKNCTAEETNLIKKLNSALMEKLTLCRELNSINGQVIATNIHTRQQIVSALSGNKSDAVSVYTSNGDMKSGWDNHHHQEA